MPCDLKDKCMNISIDCTFKPVSWHMCFKPNSQATEPAKVCVSNSSDLLYCVVCKFDKKAFDRHKELMKGGFYGPPEWDKYKPIMFKDRVSNQWVVECQNCGMHLLLHESTPEETLAQWNAIERAI